MSAREKMGCGNRAEAACFPEVKRLKYFYGQLLGASDFQTEQDYFRERLKLHNRCLHGYGTVCGLMVVAVPEEPHCEPEGDMQRKALQDALEAMQQAKELANERQAKDLDCKIEALRQQLEKLPDCGPDKSISPKVRIECGFALDCEGNELVVRWPLEVDVWRCLSQDDRKKLQDESCHDGATLYVSLCHHELPVDPVRPVVPDACGAASGCTAGKLLDTVRVQVATTCPTPDPRCETCCVPCPDPCLLLAKIYHFKPGHAIKDWQIHNGVRRLVDTPYSYATITGISWRHGGSYDAEAVKKLLFDDGMKVEFSRPVLKSSLRRGVVDLWVIQGGGGRHADIYNVDVGIQHGKDHGPTTDHVRVVARGRHGHADNPDPGDRYIFTLRAPFILDECCRPLDGAHVGGRVPLIESHGHSHPEKSHEHACPEPSRGYGPWTSGTGYPGANFESWFYVADESEDKTISEIVEEYRQ